MKFLFFIFLTIEIFSTEIKKVSWDEVSQYCKTIAQQSLEDNFHPDAIVAIGRGGLIPARILSDILSVKPLYVITLSSYTGIGEREKTIKLIQSIEKKLVFGKKILLVDDIADSGESLSFAIKYLNNLEIHDLRIATLHYKKTSCIIPNFFAQTDDRWIVYPWEIKEFD